MWLLSEGLRRLRELNISYGSKTLRSWLERWSRKLRGRTLIAAYLRLGLEALSLE